ncbi:MAG: NAD(P)-dependent alcohol dehydrogenase [Rhodobacteraceae bacterium]|nr:NAD(P)-dependent alcohol dehydrogenase [Paracoccaceae bacterium]
MKVMEICDEWSADNIRLGERPDPEPGPGEVLLKMKAASLNYRDYVMCQQGYGRRSGTLPLVPVSDGAGQVIAVGEGVSRVAVDDLVCPIFGQTWLNGLLRAGYWTGLLGGPRDGVMQEFMVLSEDGVVKAPHRWSPVQAATLPCAAVTAWNAVVYQGQVKAGDVVLVQGTGGVSLFAMLFAKMQGAAVIATSSSHDKLARLTDMGADHLINYVDTPAWHKTARDITNGTGLDLVVEVGGAGTLEKSIRAVRVGGTVSLIGVLSGATADINLGRVVTQNIRLQGVTVGGRDLFEDMVKAINLHNIEPPIDENLFAFEEVGEAIKSIPQGNHFGKICSQF